MKIFERVKQYRIGLGLSQEYVAKILGVSRTTITAIESGTRAIKAEELSVFSELFGVSSDVILNGKPYADENVKMFARAYDSLDEHDQREITNLIEFKKKLKSEEK